ncbi:hypothetical protein L1987_09906 [Smallanthus sonchifolius]|uniref:Uncharacterized protein n=1 Tax=Smallanthus sonchifolius TaxID=185202 RepID=A0ACB9JQT0_9ASTR|nr:hypothetical protein L1987_09906 [Smallanthus sonchifolius]
MLVLCYKWTKDRFKLAGKSFGGYISSGGTIALEGVKEIPDILDPFDVNNLPANGVLENCTPGSKNQSRMLTRFTLVGFYLCARSLSENFVVD